uniref:Uncharacterized protein n=1 Tax=Anguilla anguilla TaxID=7936 RepID=A0A0E9XLV0_ANGAN
MRTVRVNFLMLTMLALGILPLKNLKQHLSGPSVATATAIGRPSA